MKIFRFIGGLFLSVLIFLACVAFASPSPFLDFFFGNPNRGGYRRGYRRPKSGYSSGGYSDFRKTCHVVNPHPYAFVGSIPYPSAPVCPH